MGLSPELRRCLPYFSIVKVPFLHCNNDLYILVVAFKIVLKTYAIDNGRNGMEEIMSTLIKSYCC